MTMMMAGCVMAAVVMMTLMISQSSYSVHCRSFFTFHRYLAPEQEGDLRHIHSRPSMIYTSRNTLRDSRGVMTLSMGYLPPCFHAACPLRIIFIIGVLVGSPSSMVTRTLDSSFLSGGDILVSLHASEYSPAGISMVCRSLSPSPYSSILAG